MGCCGSDTKDNQSPNIRFDANKNFDKEKCKLLVSSLPTRTNTNLQSLKDSMKAKTGNLTDKEKSFVVFLWECQNIDYDLESYLAHIDVDCTPEGVFKNGKTVCSGYARLYKEIAVYLQLKVECVNCYAKGYGYQPGQKFNTTNHEYNVIFLDNKWIGLDATWGAGHAEGKKYIKEYNEFYFLVDPELLIKTHFPADPNWILTKKKYSLEDFSKWPHVYSNFYSSGFYKYSPDNGSIELKNKNTQKITIWRNNMKNARASCNIYLLDGNVYKQQLNISYINVYDDRCEIDLIFNKKGKYKIQIYGNGTGDSTTHSILDYTVNVENDAKKELYFPTPYDKAKNINIIEPMYDNLKSGEKVKFKIKSDLETIIIIDGKWNYLNPKENGFFEDEITIQTQPGNNLIIGQKKGTNSCDYMVSYKVV